VLLEIDSTEFDNYDQYQPYTGQKSSLIKSKVDLKPYCPSILDQGDTGACASFATVYGALTMSHAIQNQITSKTLLDKFAFSPSFLYNQLLTESDDCTRPTDVLGYIEKLKTVGACFNTNFPYSQDCKTNPNEANFDEALNYTIDHGAVLFKSSRNDTFKMSTIKSYLNDSIPVIAVIQVYDSFYEAKKPFWKKSTYDNYLGGHHVIVIVGYDELTGSFEIMNSWGNNWGNQGFIRVPFSDLVAICPSALVISPGTSNLDKQLTLNRANLENKDKDLVSTILRRKRTQQRFVRNKFDIYKVSKIEERIIKQKVPINSTATGIYSTRGVNLNDAIQIKTGTLSKNTYTYIYSINQNNKLTKHWPRITKLGQKNKYISLSPLSTNYITIPDNNTALQKSSEEEKIIVITSSKELQNLERILSNRLNFESLNIKLMESYLPNQGKLPIEFDDINLAASAILQNNSDFIITLIVNIE
jgi:hypothetical protein